MSTIMSRIHLSSRSNSSDQGKQDRREMVYTNWMVPPLLGDFAGLGFGWLVSCILKLFPLL
jgi:hypothetical protein